MLQHKKHNKHNNNNNSDNPLTSRRTDGGKKKCGVAARPRTSFQFSLLRRVF